MAKLERGKGVLVLVAGILALALGQACVRTEPAGPNGMGAASAGPQNLPFHAESGQAPSDLGLNSASAQPPSVPFKASSHSRVLPSGTLLTVDLSGSLSTARVHAGDRFTATVAAPLVVDGETLIPTGAPVTGRVESAQDDRSGAVPASGYFELSLSTIAVDGKTLVLQTSSLFARGNALHSRMVSSTASIPPRSDGVRVQKGRVLTFRLTAPVTLDGPRNIANPNSSGRTGE
jgi:hypothetical protein